MPHMDDKDRASVSYSYRDTDAYRQGRPSASGQDGDAEPERRLFELPSESAARQRRQNAGPGGDAPARPSTDAEGADAGSSFTVSLREFFWFFAYCDAVYGRSDIPGAHATVTMPIRDRDRFLRFWSDPSSVIRGGWPREESPWDGDATIVLPFCDLVLLERYWKEVCGKSDAFDPTIVVSAPREERAKFEEYLAHREGSGASAPSAQWRTDGEGKGRPGCLSGCKAAAIALLVGVALCAAGVFAAILIMHGSFENELRGDSVSADRDVLERQRIQGTLQAGDVAYVCQVPDADAGADAGARFYVFVPVEVTRETDDLVFTAAALRPNENDPVPSRLCFSEATIVGTVGEAGYAALYEAAYQAVFGFSEGTYWALYAFEADSSEFWNPQVSFLMFDDEGEVAKSFAYRPILVTLADVDAVAQEHVVREG